MKILGIESSCDETAAAVIEDGQKVLSNVVVSQIDIHAEYGGVIPEIAARSHIEAVNPVIRKALSDAGETIDSIDAIAVTHTPGLVGSLLVGTLAARTLAVTHNKPFYPIHHLKSHIYANWLSGYQPEFPLLAAVISGGHTQIIYMERHDHFEIIGSTRDDAIGECFDKVAKILGLPYPGGPNIAKIALNGNPDRYQLPIPKVDGLDFSFSGIKTAVLRTVQKELGLPITTPSHELRNHLSEQQIADFARRSNPSSSPAASPLTNYFATNSTKPSMLPTRFTFRNSNTAPTMAPWLPAPPITPFRPEKNRAILIRSTSPHAQLFVNFNFAHDFRFALRNLFDAVAHRISRAT